MRASPPTGHLRLMKMPRKGSVEAMLLRDLAVGLCVCVLSLREAAAQGTVETMKARVGEPVLQELMGGCSMKCAFPWTADAVVGKSGQTAKAIFDERADTAWIAGGPGNGIGAKLRLSFPKKIAAEMEGEVPFYGLDLINGYWKSEELWRQYGRVKKARLSYNGRPLCEVTFADSRRWERITFPDIMVRSGDSLMFEVLEIYPGEKPGLAISEIVLQGAH